MNRLTIKFSVVLGIAFLVFSGLPKIAQAAGFLGLPSLADVVGGAARLITFAIAYILGLFIALAGQLIDFVLLLNINILRDNVIIEIGWRIIRDITNLGFVLIIIIIAFATILRLQQYGVKKLLPKLIAAAILVNFSFAIAGVFIDFSNVLTNFFTNQATSGNVGTLSEHMAGAFGIQGFFLEEGGADPIAPGLFSEDQGGEGRFGAAVLLSIAQLVFTVIFLTIAFLVMMAFALMLLIRYLWLTFLVILAPIVWLFWVIPALSGQFKKWWNKFLQWIFFAPALSFFLYLAFLSVQGLSEQKIVFRGALSAIMTQGAQMVVLAGILIGGLIVAQQMGITGASGAIGIASKAGKGVRGWAGRRALQTGTYPLRGAIGRKATEGLQNVGMGQGGGLIRRGFRNVGKYTGVNSLLRQTGKGVSTLGIVQGENLVKQAERKQNSLSDKQLGLRVATMNNFDRVAALSRLAKNKSLWMVPNVAQHIANPNTKAMFESYGGDKDYLNFEKTFGANTEMLTAKTGTEREAASKKFYSSFLANDLNKVEYNNIYSKDSKVGLNNTDHALLQRAITYGIAVNNPGDIRKVLVNVKSENIENVDRAVNDTATNIWSGNATRIGDTDLAEKIEKVMENTLAKRFAGELFEFPQPGGTATTPSGGGATTTPKP